MGVWERSRAGRAIVNQNKDLVAASKQVLTYSEDKVGSSTPFDARLWTSILAARPGRAVARQELANRGVTLLLDFVPNHVAPHRPWVGEHLELVKGNGRRLIVINLSETALQTHVRVPREESSELTWHFADTLSDATYERNGCDILTRGLHKEIAPWATISFSAATRAGFFAAIAGVSSGFVKPRALLIEITRALPVRAIVEAL